MRARLLLLILLPALALSGRESQIRTFRQWLGGQEAGGATQELRKEGGHQEVRSREWMVISRLGQEVRQEAVQTVLRTPAGGLTFTWRLTLSSEPFEGRAEWSPETPGTLSIQPSQGPAVHKEVPAGAILWPDDLESRLKEAARAAQPVEATTFSFPLMQWSTLRLKPQGAAPLPGFPDAVRFTGEETQGPNALPVEVWISPTAGELRHQTSLGGLEVLTQRAELPGPAPGKGTAGGFFERTLQKLPPHPFLPWIPDLTLKPEGTPPSLPEDAQQIRLPEGRWRLLRAAAPSGQEATQAPVEGTPAPEEAPYVAPSPLVPFRDPAFDGLIHRMALPPGLSRWELAQRVNRFVFEWITDKDFSVGFASAAETCRKPKGDCTEHGVLAVALLRRLGVPARGVTGWAALGDTLGLHFWVEIRLQRRWVPIDPTFDQAPASAFRIKLGDTDLSDLGSIGWEGAATAFSGLRWIPEQEGALPWGRALRIQDDQASGPWGPWLRLPGGRWEWRNGILRLRGPKGGAWQVQASTRPVESQLQGAQRLAGGQSRRQGWWQPAHRRLWADLGGGRWIQVDGLSEAEAFVLLDQLLAPSVQL